MPKKFFKKLFIFLLLLMQTFSLLFFVFIPSKVKADASVPQWENPFDKLQIKIPGMKKFSEVADCPDDPSKKCVKWISEYIAGLYQYAIGIVGILAAVVLMIGGIIWLTAGGNQTRIGTAKSYITASITGLVIALSSYLILYQINPELIKLKPIKITMVKKMPSEIVKAGCAWKTGVWQGDIPTTNGCGDGFKLSIYSDCPAKTDSQALDPTIGCCCPTMQWTSQCSPPSSGACSVNNLKAIGGLCFGNNIEKAAAICNAESANGTLLESTVDKCEPGKEVVSFGLFQINISAHDIGGYSCINSFNSGPYTGSDHLCSVKDNPTYNNCKNAAKDYIINIQKACEISGGGNSWSQWGVYNNYCKNIF